MGKRSKAKKTAADGAEKAPKQFKADASDSERHVDMNTIPLLGTMSQATPVGDEINVQGSGPHLVSLPYRPRAAENQVPAASKSSTGPASLAPLEESWNKGSGFIGFPIRLDINIRGSAILLRQTDGSVVGMKNVKQQKKTLTASATVLVTNNENLSILWQLFDVMQSNRRQLQREWKQKGCPRSDNKVHFRQFPDAEARTMPIVLAKMRDNTKFFDVVQYNGRGSSWMRVSGLETFKVSQRRVLLVSKMTDSNDLTYQDHRGRGVLEMSSGDVIIPQIETVYRTFCMFITKVAHCLIDYSIHPVSLKRQREEHSEEETVRLPSTKKQKGEEYVLELAREVSNIFRNGRNPPTKEKEEHVLQLAQEVRTIFGADQGPSAGKGGDGKDKKKKKKKKKNHKNETNHPQRANEVWQPGMPCDGRHPKLLMAPDDMNAIERSVWFAEELEFWQVHANDADAVSPHAHLFEEGAQKYADNPLRCTRDHWEDDRFAPARLAPYQRFTDGHEQA